MTYTPGEVAKLLDIPPSTLRRYVAEFGEFLSQDAKRRRSRRFDDNDLAVISRIRDLTGEGLTFEAIPARLDDIAPVEGPQTALDFPGLQKSIDQILENFEDQQRDINELRRRLDELRQDLEDERSKPWYKRLFGG